MLRASAALVAVLVVTGQPLLTLEIRVFRGTEDVTAQTRVTVHPAGERGQPLAQIAAGDPRTEMKVKPGIYDAQAVQEQNGRVVGIRWAERLVVMPYPDEGGHHLEVINLIPGYGALQIRRGAPGGAPRDVALFPARDRAAALPAAAPARDAYVLFVVRAGRYDIQLTGSPRPVSHDDIEVPLDRTRLWIVP